MVSRHGKADSSVETRDPNEGETAAVTAFARRVADLTIVSPHHGVA